MSDNYKWLLDQSKERKLEIVLCVAIFFLAKATLYQHGLIEELQLKIEKEIESHHQDLIDIKQEFLEKEIKEREKLEELLRSYEKNKIGR